MTLANQACFVSVELVFDEIDRITQPNILTAQIDNFISTELEQSNRHTSFIN